MAKFGALYVRPGHRVLITPRGDMMVRPTPLDHKLSIAGQPATCSCCKPVSCQAMYIYASYPIINVVLLLFSHPLLPDWRGSVV